MLLPFEKIYDADLIHPTEEEMMRECQKNSLYDWLARELSALKNRTEDCAEALLWMYPVTKATAPRLNKLYAEVLNRLGCEEIYPLFLKWEYEIRIQVTGSSEDGNIITLSSAALDELDDLELMALLGQAVGQIKANHAHNLQMISLLEESVGSLPLVGAIAKKKLWSSFAEWIIAAQFTTDRFALQACGSERAVASLLLKQNGLKDFDLARILKQPIRKPNQLGIYFVWLVKTLPVFGAVERIQELRRWIRSEKFRQNYPGFYYRLRLEDSDGEISSAMKLHRAAAENDSDSIMQLVECYIAGEEDLPRSFFMVEELSKAASFLGNAKGMYIFARCLEKSLGKADKNILRRLYEASASRGFGLAREKIQGERIKNKPELVEKIIAEFTSVGKMNSFEVEAEQVRNAFWMNTDEEIFAVETFLNRAGELFGTAMTATGIYGRLSEKDLPYFVSWDRIQKCSIYRRKNFLWCDEVALYRVAGDLKGTVGELIVRLAHKLQR